MTAKNWATLAILSILWGGSFLFIEVALTGFAVVTIVWARVAGAAVAFECRVAQILPYPPIAANCHLIFAEVLLAHIDDAVLNAQGRIDAAKLDLVGRLGGTAYSRTRDTFEMRRPG